MDINKYMALVKTVEYGSFTKAAEILSYSQSGISKMVRDLEDVRLEIIAPHIVHYRS